MKLEDYQEYWEGQPTGAIVSQGHTVVAADLQRRNRITFAMLAFFLLNVAAAMHFFWASYFLRQEAIWIALMRCSLFVFLAVVQYFVWRKLRHEATRRDNCALDQRQCLGRLVEDLDCEIGDSNPIRAVLPLALVGGFVACTKWIDFRMGHDSASECITITLLVMLATSMVPIGMWHYRQRFLIPRRDYICGVLASLNGA